jgi:hypothetical protein
MSHAVSESPARLAGALKLPILIFGLLSLTYLVVGDAAAMYLPAVLGAGCLLGLGNLLRRSPMAVWTPIFWFLFTSAIYYGVGPLIYLSADIGILDYLASYYDVDPVALHRTNLLSVVSILAICVVYEGTSYWLVADRTRHPIPAQDEDERTRRLLLLTAALGYLSRGGIYAMRWLAGQDVTVFGFLIGFAELTKVALLIAVYRFVRGGKGLLPLLLIGGVELFTAVGSLMKSQVLEVGLAGFLGVYLARPSRKLLMSSLAGGVAAYLVMVPISYAARAAWDTRLYSSVVGVSAVVAQLGGEGQTDDLESQNVWWARLAQPPAQGYAMRAFDEGRPGRTFVLAPFVLIPRVIWPDKPFISFGGEFTLEVTGTNAMGGSGPGYFGEAYWNFGWLGVVGMSLMVGWIFAFFSRQNVVRISSRDLRWLPVLYLSLRMGFRPDDWFVATTIAILPFMLIFWIIFYPVLSSTRTSAGREDGMAGAAPLRP